MARITIEDCLRRVSNRFMLVHATAKRVRQMREGAQYLVHSPKNEDIVIALRELAAGKMRIVAREIEEKAVKEEEVSEEAAKPEEVSEEAVKEEEVSEEAAKEEEVSEEAAKPEEVNEEEVKEEEVEEAAKPDNPKEE